MRSREFLHLVIHSSASILNGFKISDIYQLILALIRRFGVILVLQKLDVQFNGRVFIEYKDTR